MDTEPVGFEERKGGEFLFDFDDFERMAKAGMFARVDDRVELIEGRIHEMAPISLDHGEIAGATLIGLANRLKAAGFGREAFKVITHATLKIGKRSAPEPDVFVVRPATGKYAEADDAVLVVEVSISTGKNDLTTKSRLYARAGVPEFWMIEPEYRRLRVFRDPQADGSWASMVVLEGDDQTVSPLFAPQISLPLTELF
ncbi:MAG: hypothetical protein JWP92_3139 [Caulobacter sp.]|nr:hypothetical protein [Caulobacter sp.]